MKTNTGNKIGKISEVRPWMKYYPEELHGTSAPKNTIYGYLKDTCKDRLDCVALHYYGSDITYRKFISRIEECARAFTAIGVKHGDMVSMVSVSTPEALIAMYALNKIGASLNSIDPRMDTESIKRMINESNSDVLIALDIAFSKIKAIMDDIDQRHIIVQSTWISLPPVKKLLMKVKNKCKIPYSDTIVSWQSFIKNGEGINAEEAPYVGDATVAVTYTGGTTGFPKGVMLTNDSMNSVAYNFIYSGLVYEKGQRFLGIMPIFSSYGMVCGLHMPLNLGLELVLIPGFVPVTIGKLVRKYKPEHMISTPAFYEILIQSKEVKNMDLSFMITLGSGGDSMNAGLEGKLEQFMKEHNIRYPLAQGYGMSEVSAPVSFCVDDRYKKGSVGIPCVTTLVGIFDPETGNELGYGERGEICISGPSMMKGYFNRSEETDIVMRRHGDGRIWVHSGDIGYMDEDGFLFVEGRIKRMITRFDGHKVFPINIESLVSEHQAVRNCVVIGINDRDHVQGQYPMALVELANGSDSDKICREIFDICNARLEERGKPVAVVSVDSVGLTGFGKNDYRVFEKGFENFDYLAWQNRCV
ncbi:MAG: acyl--CoA ligase [Clostridia bacterium]|nr:acyl--CoA ligase [Clostridia bacterium]